MTDDRDERIQHLLNALMVIEAKSPNPGDRLVAMLARPWPPLDPFLASAAANSGATDEQIRAFFGLEPPPTT